MRAQEERQDHDRAEQREQQPDRDGPERRGQPPAVGPRALRPDQQRDGRRAEHEADFARSASQPGSDWRESPAARERRAPDRDRQAAQLEGGADRQHVDERVERQRPGRRERVGDLRAEQRRGQHDEQRDGLREAAAQPAGALVGARLGLAQRIGALVHSRTLGGAMRQILPVPVVERLDAADHADSRRTTPSPSRGSR